MNEETSEMLYCPLSKPYSGMMEKFIQNGRQCTVDSVICFGWDDPEKQKTCPVRLYGRKAKIE